MTRYIDADLFKAELNMGHCTGELTGPDDVEKLLDLQPTADVKEVVRGNNTSEANPVDKFRCSECGIILEGWVGVEIDDHDNDESNYEYEFNFCPSCGADMREVK